MQNWEDLYQELAIKIDEIDGIKWVDFWHNQVNFLDQEHQFPTPAVFLAFRTNNVEDMGDKIQKVGLQVEAYLFYETFADTYKGALNQQSALSFIKLLGALYAKLHGTSGANYENMRRIGFGPVDTGGAGNLYQSIFTCDLIDTSAQDVFEEAEDLDMEVEKGVGAAAENLMPMFEIPG